MPTDQPTPTTPRDPWAHPDANAAPVPPPGTGHPVPQPGTGYPGYAAPQPGAGYPGYPAPQPGPGYPGYPAAPAAYPYGAVPPGLPGYVPDAVQVPRKYDQFAVAGFVLSLIGGSLVALVLGIMGLVRTRDGRAKGRGLAIAAVTIALVWVAGIFVVLAAQNQEPVSAYTVGDCVQVSASATAELDGDDAPTVPKVDCAVPHNGEVFATKTLPSGSYPGLAAVEQDAESFCLMRFDRFVGLAYDDSQLGFFYVYPQETGWFQGDRDVACVLLAGADVTGTLQNAAR